MDPRRLRSRHRESHPGATRNFSLGRPGAGPRTGILAAPSRTTAAAPPTKKHPRTIHTVKPAPASPHRPTTQHRITADNILWDASRGSAPRPISRPCITIAEARYLGLIPPDAIIVGDPLGCITYSIVDGHIVVALTYAPFPPGTLPPDGHVPQPPNENPIAWRLNGDPYFGAVVEDWTSQRIIDELSAGFVGAMMDCWDSADPLVQYAVINALQEETDFFERQLMRPPFTPDTANRPPPRDAFYAYLKELICRLMDWLFDPACPPEGGPDNPDITAALILAEFCQHTLLDDLLAKLARCDAAQQAPPTPEEPPEAPPEDEPQIPQGGCVCNYWPGWIICPDCEATSGYKCTCPGDCIPFPASYRNC